MNRYNSTYSPVTAAIIRSTVKRMKSGVSLKVCARDRGVSRWTLRDRMKAMGLPTRRPSLPRKCYIDYPPTERSKEIVRLVKKLGTQDRAAELLGISRQAVSQHMRRYALHV